MTPQTSMVDKYCRKQVQNDYSTLMSKLMVDLAEETVSNLGEYLKAYFLESQIISE